MQGRRESRVDRQPAAPRTSLLFTIGRALTVGRRDALLSVAGNAIGLLVQVVTIALALGPEGSPRARWPTGWSSSSGRGTSCGWGVQSIRHRSDALAALVGLEAGAIRPAAGRTGHDASLRSLRVGVVVGLTNPKTLVVVVAFLLHFVNDAAGYASVQVVLLGLVFCLMAVAVE